MLYRSLHLPGKLQATHWRLFRMWRFLKVIAAVQN
jgi:hypothetical protein